MFKKAMLRGLNGIPVGITIGYLVTIIISAIYGNGAYLAIVPELVESTGSELNAILLQTFYELLIGFTFAAATVVWDTEWSLLKQTSIYFLITALISLPIAYFANWMPHNATGFLIYFAIYIGIFLVIWLIIYLVKKHEVKEMNARINANKDK